MLPKEINQFLIQMKIVQIEWALLFTVDPYWRKIWNEQLKFWKGLKDKS